MSNCVKGAGIEPGGDNNYGLPTPETYDPIEMRDIIRNERRIEMAFEESTLLGYSTLENCGN